VELAGSDVRVNLLVPGRFETALNPRAAAADAGDIPLGRVGTPEECGPAALLLLSDALGSYITGAELVVSGGLHLRPLPGPQPAARV
jgi:NAD(P)-dependent dehydrogenase (short-subunit alcohol dehydrogenase family)